MEKVNSVFNKTKNKGFHKPVRHLLCKHKDLCWNPKTYVKMSGVVACTSNPSAEEKKANRSPECAGQLSLVKPVGPTLSKRLYFKNKEAST